VTFGKKLHDLREAKGLTQLQLAEATGLHLGTIRNYEQGIRMPTFAAVVKIARALKVKLTAFARCDDVRGTPPPEGRGRKKK
jgi:transcriptional regulator with XRE-family HTH domain